MKKQPLNFGKIVSNVFVIVLLFSFGQNLIAQKNILKLTNITGGKAELAYERMVTMNSSIIVGLRGNDQYQKNNFKDSGVQFGGEYRLYLSQKKKALSGFYLAPNFSVGHHQVSYSRTDNDGIGLGLLFFVFDLADGEVNGNYSSEAPKTVTGDAKVMTTGLGIKIGVQKIWNRITLDFGANISKNSVSGHSGGLLLSDGTRKSFNANLDGLHPELYLGIGFAF